MRIETEQRGTLTVVKLSGRLDAAWAEHFLNAVREVIREGRHHVRVDASGLEYMSSAGIRPLLRLRGELQALQGTFGIVRAAAFVEDTLRTSGLGMLLVEEEAVPTEAEAPVEAAPAESGGQGEAGGMLFERHDVTPGARVRVTRHDGWRPWEKVREEALVEAGFPARRFGLGIGAAGATREDARDRLGEFVAAAGCVAWLPGDGADRPDFLESVGDFVPRLTVVQSVVGEGDFAQLVRFQPGAPGALLTLSDLCATVLETTRSRSAALVAVLEVEGLVGVSLARSPGRIGTGDRPGDFPEMRDWLAFCGERVHRNELAVVVGFVSDDGAHPFSRQCPAAPSRPGLHAHAHAAVAPYRTLPQGALELDTTVRAVFEDNLPLALLHLFEDDRPGIGLGQSAFVRGACWCAPMDFSTEALS